MSVSIHGHRGNDVSYDPAISGDGRYVVFISRATDLVRRDTNHHTDVFVRDRALGTIRRIDVTPSGGQATGHGTNKGRIAADISTHGLYVAFSHDLPGLVVGDTNGKMDVFLRDMQMNVTARASVAHDGTQLDSLSSDPFVCGPNAGFTTAAGITVPNDTNNVRDVFLRGPFP